MDNTLLVFGASSSVGCQYIRAYNKRYRYIYAHYNQKSDELNDLKKEIGDRITLIKDDLNRMESGSEILNRIVDQGIWPNHILHCAAPQIKNIRFADAEWEDFQSNINIMIRSSVNVLPKVFRKLIKEKRVGHCVFVISSCTDSIPPKFESAYVTAKYAQLGLMKSLSSEYSDRGIMVNGISPGMMETSFLANMFSHAIEDNAAKSPFGRNLNVDEILPMIDFLLSNAADRITGQNIVVSGGM